MKYPRYQKYRPSGIEWIGDVPERWGLKPLGALVRIVGGGTPDKARPDYWVGSIPWVSPKDFTSDWIDFAEDHISEEALRSSATRLIPRGAALVVVRSGILRRTIPVALNRVPVALNQDVKALIPTSSSASIDFLRWFIRGHEDVLLTTCRHQGATVESLEVFSLRKIPIPNPPPPEQVVISAFLDAKTAEIDALIAKKESLVQLLEEKRAALIAHAVTKGLDPKAPMKESGSPWVGRVPEHWRYARVAYVADVFNGSTPDRDNPDYWEQGDVPWLSSGKVNDGTVTEADEFVTQKALRECSIRRMPAGSVLVGMIGQGKTRGMSAFMEMSACINQNVAAVVPRAGTNGRFLHFVFKAAYLPLREFGRGGQQDALNCDLIKAFRIPIPPAPEQEQIARYLGQKTAWVDELSSKVCLAIDRLREYRTALISAAVTGKIDIRNLTPTAPCQ